MNDNVSFSWSTPEYEHRPKRPDWFWAVGIIGFSAGAIAMVYHNFLFGIFIFIAAATLIMTNLKLPRSIDCEISSEGIRIGGMLYPYKNIKKFSVVGEGSDTKLIFETDRYFMPHHYVAIPGDSSVKVTDFLEEYISYDEGIKEPAAHKIMDRMGI